LQEEEGRSVDSLNNGSDTESLESSPKSD